MNSQDTPDRRERIAQAVIRVINGHWSVNDACDAILADDPSQLTLAALAFSDREDGIGNPLTWKEIATAAEAKSQALAEALELILPLAKGYRPEDQSPKARLTCDRWIDGAEAALKTFRGEP
jgi:hypothetical protein